MPAAHSRQACLVGWVGLLRLIATALLALAPGLARGGEINLAADRERIETRVAVTNVAQFRAVPRERFLGDCPFRLEGMITLVDSNRDLLVVQDATGAVAISPKNMRGLDVQIGQSVLLRGSRCFPHVVGFPSFPYRPTGWEVRPALEGPENWGTYYLTRMRGYLHPPATGEYTFWIASDNSSELWLSADADPAKVKKIAFLSRYGWVAPRDWSRYPSQRSESIFLQAGQRYYFDVFQEQTSGADHLAVAWEGPSVKQAVVANRFLTPWSDAQDSTLLQPTNGVRREYWTNFSLGGLATLAGPKPFESTLSVEELNVTLRDNENWLRPRVMSFNRPLRPEDNYLWVETQGVVTFAGQDGEVGLLELSDGEAQLQVRVLRCDPETVRRLCNAIVRVTGVCEGIFNRKGELVPGLVWVVQAGGIEVIEAGKTNLSPTAVASAPKSGLTNINPAMVGYYGTRGVVTFNDRVFGEDVMFVQEDNAALRVSLKDRNYGNRFEVGQWVDLGGNLQPGKNISILNPMAVTELGWHFMPEPLPAPVQFPVPANRDGRWTEVAGVVHAVNANGTLTLMASSGPLIVWVGKTSSAALERLVDARLRMRGVLSLTLQDLPILLVPSTRFVNVEREAPGDPFSLPTRLAGDLFSTAPDGSSVHRVKLAGHITFADNSTLFLQDASAGVRVKLAELRTLAVGQAVEVVGFPSANGVMRTLTEALVRPVDGIRAVPPQQLDAGDGISFKYAGALVEIKANLFAQQNKNGRQVLELQEKQRIFEAELPPGSTALPAYAPGSRLQLSGVCDFATAAAVVAGGAADESPSVGALKILLRSPADVVRLSGPPWWTWKHTSVLVGGLLTVLVVSMLRIQLLRHRLDRQLAISRQMLEGQESERHRIAANLHDSLGQNLLVIKNQARLAMQPAADEALLRQRLDEISGCASQAIEEVREITHALRPYQLDRLGLTQTIRATVNRAAENSPVLFASHVDDIDGLLDKESEIHAYRIVQEAINNILKHSAATEATVVVKRLTATVSLSVRDNGRGFDPAAPHDPNRHDVGHGLSGIKERARILGGGFQLDARPGQGTTLTIEIPVPKQEAA